MSEHKSRRLPARAYHNQGGSPDGGGSSSSSSKGSPVEEADTLGLVGRLVAKYRGETLLRGVVNEYNKPTEGQRESWTVLYDEKLEKVGRSELEKQLHMQTVELESLPAKRGRGRPRKSTKGSAAGQTAPSLKPGGAKKQRSGISSSLVSKATPKNGKGKGNAGGRESMELQAASFIGKRMAKHFPGYGVFTGEVMKVKAKGALFNVMFEDGEEEDYSEDEIEEHTRFYTHLSQSFAIAPMEDGATESESDDDATTPTSKRKAKDKRKHVGARVRVFFPGHDDYFNGTVKKHLAPEDDDTYEDLFHVVYDDGDSEDLDSKELEEAMAVYNYNKRYPLVRKKVSISTSTKKTKKVALFGENREGSPVFGTVQGYHNDGRFKETS